MNQIESLYVAVGALAAAVGLLFRATSATAAECNRDRRELWDYIRSRFGDPPPPPPAP